MHTRTTATALALLFAASALTGVAACGEDTGPKTAANAQPNVNRLEHEARRHLADVREEVQRNLNPNEHQAYAGLEPKTDPEPGSDPRTCREALAEAAERGGLSDGYERYVLRQSPCTDPR